MCAGVAPAPPPPVGHQLTDPIMQKQIKLTLRKRGYDMGDVLGSGVSGSVYGAMRHADKAS